MSAKPAARIDLSRAALMAGCLAVGVLAWDTPALWPFKLLAVMAHETGHALATLFVGGGVQQVTISGNEAGACLSSYPDSFFAKVLVYSGGYVGNALISALLLLLTFRFNARRLILGAACVWLVAMGVFYARDGFTLAFCAVMAALFGLAARMLPLGAVGLLNTFLASFNALYAAFDLRSDLWNGAVRAQSDAQLLANVTFLPAFVWAGLWSVCGLALLGWGLWLALRTRGEPSRRPGAARAAVAAAR